MNTLPDHPELEAVRARFIGALSDGHLFAHWVGHHAVNDMYWLFGAIDGMLFWQEIMSELKQRELEAETKRKRVDPDDDEVPF